MELELELKLKLPRFSGAVVVGFSFADPRSPWQRGTNENTNRLLRQYFPKGVTMKDLTQAELNQVAAKLNARPRKTLDFDTPAARFEALLR